MILFWLIFILMTLFIAGLVCYPLRNASSKFNPRRLAFLNTGVTISVIIMPPVFYFFFGDSEELSKKIQRDNQIKEVRHQLIAQPGRLHLIEQLLKIMEKKPADAQGWFLLAKLYLNNREYAKAVDAFEKVNHLVSNQPSLIALQAKALYLETGKMTPEIQLLLKKVFLLEKENKIGLSLLAFSAYQQRDYKRANYIWRKLLRTLEPNSLEAHQLSAMQKQASNAERFT